MKKTIILFLALSMAGSISAQSKDGAEQIQGKKGIDLMPEKGDFAIGMNMIPVINYVGSLFGKNTNTYMNNGWNKFFGGNTVYGKYMLTDQNAIRFNFRAGINNSTSTFSVFDDAEPNPDFKVEDSRKNKNTDINIGVGYEWRRGKNRFRGIFGGEILYNFNSGDNRTYTYGNEMGASNVAPTSTFNQFGSQNPGFGVSEGERIISQKGGHFHGGGVRLFAGVEYFIAPKICLGTEFGYGLTIGQVSSSVRTTEYFDAGLNEVSTREFRSVKTNRFILDTDNFNGAVYLMFYF